MLFPRPWLVLLFMAASGWGYTEPLSVEDRALVDRARAKVGSTEHEICAYTLSSDNGQTKTRVRFDPSGGGNPWQLLEQDGKSPDRAEAEEYEAPSQASHPANVDVSGLDSEDLHVLRRNPDRVVFGFSPRDDRGDLIHKSVSGELSVRRADAVLISTLISGANFRRAVVVKMRDFRIQTMLDYDPEVGAVVMQAMDMAMDGSVALKKIEVGFHLDFGDFDCP